QWARRRRPHRWKAGVGWRSRGARHGRYAGRRGGESPAARCGGRNQERAMFDALEMSLKILEVLVPIEARVRRKNLDLAKQIASAAESISLNLGEGRARRDGDRRRHYEMAAGSASELTTALRVAVAKRILTEREREPVELVLDRVRAMLYR